MVLKQLVNLKYFEKIISNIQRFEGLEEGKNYMVLKPLMLPARYSKENGIA